MNNYPHPVLSPGNSAYRDEIRFEIKYKSHAFADDSLIIDLGISCNSKKLQDDFEQKKIKAIVKTTLKTAAMCDACELINGDIRVIIPSEKILAYDTISIKAYLLAAEKMNMEWWEELSSDYPKDYCTEVRKNDVLAESNEEGFNSNPRNNNFIRFKEVENGDGSGIRIDLSNQNYIIIKVGHKFNEAYGKIKGKEIIRNITNSHLLFEALVYILIELAQNRDEYVDMEWYLGMQSTFDIKGFDDLDAFLDNVKEDGIKIDLIYEVAQKMINNQIELSLIAAKESEDLKHD